MIDSLDIVDVSAAARSACSALASCSPAGLPLDHPATGASPGGGERGAFGPTRLKLDVWTPRGAAAGARLPVVIFFYGGGWAPGRARCLRVAAARLRQPGLCHRGPRLSAGARGPLPCLPRGRRDGGEMGARPCRRLWRRSAADHLAGHSARQGPGRMARQGDAPRIAAVVARHGRAPTSPPARRPGGRRGSGLRAPADSRRRWRRSRARRRPGRRSHSRRDRPTPSRRRRRR